MTTAQRATVRVRGLSKRYRIGSAPRYKTLRDALAAGIGAPFALFAGRRRAARPTFWALDDVGFDVGEGEVFGLIGRNGAGKSTLLKILSRITEPTAGRVELYGRVGSLLEVGTGFHPELSGRENIFLNGAILGMRRAEILRKFDEIVAFAEIERFLDTPVKHYSSGMYTRLAFSVAAHLEPEILLVDEVLAVGDLAFQRKCMGKMSDVAGSGRTVILVSHNLSAIWSLCRTVLWLDEGRIRRLGPCAEVVQAYREEMRADVRLAESVSARRGDGKMRAQSISLANAAGDRVGSVACGATGSIRVDYELAPGVEATWRDIEVNILIQSPGGERLVPLCSWLDGRDLGDLPRRGSIACTLPRVPLCPGSYDLVVSCALRGNLCDKLDLPQFLIVTEGDYFDVGRLPKESFGRVYVDASWSVAESCAAKVEARG
jgi:lipopolysaccharide transport system ATP-binding protein